MLMEMKLSPVEALGRHHLTLRLQDSHIFTHWRQRETIRECCDDDGKDPYQCRQPCMHQSEMCLIISISHHYLMCGEPPHSLHRQRKPFPPPVYYEDGNVSMGKFIPYVSRGWRTWQRQALLLGGDDARRHDFLPHIVS